jgi:hypothetical protein
VIPILRPVLPRLLAVLLDPLVTLAGLALLAWGAWAAAEAAIEAIDPMHRSAEVRVAAGGPDGQKGGR